MIVRSLRPLVVAVLLGLVASLVAACGEEERTGLLSQTRATQIKDGLADVNEAVQDGSCVRVREELSGVRTQLGELPQSTDPELRDRLQEGVAHLEDIAPTECSDRQPETTPQTTPDTEPETTPEVVPTEPAPTEPVPTQPVEPPVTTPPDTGEGDGGGGGGEETPGNGNGPPGGVPPGQDDDSGGQEAPGAELE
jgi:hypothetical protein